MKSSIYVKLVFVFMVVIIPIYGLGLLFTQWAAGHMREEIENSMNSRSMFYSSSLETELTRSIGLLKEFLYDDDLLMLSVAGGIMSPIEKTAAVNRFQKRLDILQRSSSFLVDVSAYLPYMKRVISSREFYGEFDDNAYQSLKQMPVEGTVFQLDGKFYAKYTQPGSYFFEKEDAAALMVLQISDDNIRHDLQSFIDRNGGGAMLISKDMSWNIASETFSRFTLSQIESLLDGTKEKKILYSESSESSYLTSIQETPYFYLMLYVPEDQVMQPLGQYKIWLVVISSVALLLVMIFSYWIYRMIHQPLKRMIGAFRKVRKGSMNVVMEHKGSDEFRDLYEQFNFMIERIQYLLKEVYEQRYLKQRAELKHLQSQINPHFLYNSFFILNRMIAKEDMDNAYLFTENLGKYFQYITSSDTEEVPLHKEIDFIRSYTEIQSRRFSNRIQIRWGPISNEMQQIIIPKLCIQPIVENAFLHGLNKVSENGLLVIAFKQDSYESIISIEDNGAGMSAEELEKLNRSMISDPGEISGNGLFNVHRRLQLKYGQGSGLVIKNGETSGLCVEIHIVNGGRQSHVSNAYCR